jgi:hypothetical protein
MGARILAASKGKAFTNHLATQPQAGLRGGAFASASYSLPASNRYGTVGGLLATGEGTHVGFRVVMVPEPSSLGLADKQSTMVL